MWAAQQRNLTNQGTFEVFASLALFMIAVVGGIGYVSGALLAGIFLSVLQRGHARTSSPSSATTTRRSIGCSRTCSRNFTKYVGPALIGIGLGKNPSGIANQIMEGFGRAPKGQDSALPCGSASSSPCGSRLARRHRQLDVHGRSRSSWRSLRPGSSPPSGTIKVADDLARRTTSRTTTWSASTVRSPSPTAIATTQSSASVPERSGN